ncbi:arylamine N-acetyltransferase [Paenibacillus sp. GCM10012303]|uniref:arylamine N-acetyltransferase family protein n=1 Tax=Paenibacillus sp. GCM10012303 TaxID=3317340 RepID=UPI00361EBFD8
MSELTALFRKRIGLSGDEPIAWDSLPSALAQMAITIPFENFGIIRNRINDISERNLIQKIIFNREGGLCYELNPLLYLVLIDNGFDAVLTRGVVYNHASRTYMSLGRTHVTILIAHQGETYLADTGFGGNLPLTPVPLSGETVSSLNGQFRIRHRPTDHGDYTFEMKLKHKDTDWRIGYAFDSKRPEAGLSELNEIQKIIAGHEESPFNKNRLITRLTNSGNVTLTDQTFTEWRDGHVTKEEMNRETFSERLYRFFEMEDSKVL